MIQSELTVEGFLTLLDQMKQKNQKSITDAPEGYLHIKTNSKVPEYYHRLSGGKEIYILIGHHDDARKLAQKPYSVKVQKILHQHAAQMNLILEQLPHPEHARPLLPALMAALYSDLDMLYDSLPLIRQNLITPIVPTTKQFVKGWLEEPYERLPFRETDHSSYYSDQFGRLRSKSELYIADRIIAAALPAKYECPLYLNHYHPLHPDFTILDTRTRCVKYLEHCGMMEDPSYLEGFMKKLRTYESNGIRPGESLILTFESQTQPLDTRTINRIPELYFPDQLPWRE